MVDTRKRRSRGPVLLAAAITVWAAGAAEGQRSIPGFTRSDQSDVTGPSVTSGDQLGALYTEPGTVRSMYCPVAWGVRTTAERVQLQLASAGLQPATGGPTIGSTAQLLVLNLLLSPRGDRQAAEQVHEALTASNSSRARGPARRLVEDVRGLFHVVEGMDPLRPGEVAPTRLTRAVGAYNGLVDASSPEFLANPPAEFAAIHAVLNQLVIASLENDGRAARPEVVDEAGLACAILAPPAPTPAPPPPRPPVEQAIEICILHEGEFRNVPALRRPELGDTMVIVAGERRPLAEVYPTAAEVATPPWVPLGEPVSIGTRQYQPFGVSRVVRPGELVRRGEVQGHGYYVLPPEPASPAVIYFISAPNCEVQPYRAAETIRVRG